MTSLRAEPLAAAGFEPFGRVVEMPGRDQDASGPGWDWWAETDVLPSDGRPWVFGHLALEPVEPRFDWAERHLRSSEVILAGPSDILVYVGVPDANDPDRLPDLESFKAFRVPAGDGVILAPGVWHGAPFALTEPTSALVLLLEGTGRDDVLVVRFQETPVSIEVARS